MPDENSGKKSVGGRPRKLTDAQLGELAALLSKGATAHGWPNELWTAKRMAKVIRRHFNVPCDSHHAWLMVTKYLGWTLQRPIQQLRAADEDEINRWLEEDFPRIVDRANRRGAYLVFLDESGFMLSPTVRQTYAPRGHPPVCKVTDPHGRISVIGAMTISPQRRHFGLCFDLLRDNANYRGETIVPFLERLYGAIRGPLTILWDAIPIHRADPVTRFLHKRRTIVSELFPRYAPDLNPVDKIWFYVKYDRIPNFAPLQLSDLRVRVNRELRRLQQHPEVLKSLFHMTSLSSDF
jgi:transposase